MIRSKAGTQFDPRCVNALLRLESEIQEIVLRQRCVTKTLTAMPLQQTCEGVLVQGNEGAFRPSMGHGISADAFLSAFPK